MGNITSIQIYKPTLVKFVALKLKLRLRTSDDLLNKLIKSYEKNCKEEDDE